MELNLISVDGLFLASNKKNIGQTDTQNVSTCTLTSTLLFLTVEITQFDIANPENENS